MYRSPDAVIDRTPDTVRRVYLMNGEAVEGPLTFASDGTIGAYARYVRNDGVIVPFHAVAVAIPVGTIDPVFSDR